MAHVKRSMTFLSPPSFVTPAALERLMMADGIESPRSCREVARPASRKLALGDPGELGGCPNMARTSSTSRRTVSPGAEFARGSLTDSGHCPAKFGQQLTTFGKPWQMRAKVRPSLAKMWPLPSLAELGQPLAKMARIGQRSGFANMEPNLCSRSNSRTTLDGARRQSASAGLRAGSLLLPVCGVCFAGSWSRALAGLGAGLAHGVVGQWMRYKLNEPFWGYVC